ncbi:zf-HC2 domain-containing protein [Tepidibacillus sp. HK-1]|uniref:zf-HC2 domain-containing protein n=1 Tax=Tepidibacillus sp. HK-1 TaxID=1883407 RepID=UPI000852E207|nr:zf-HC2 domain-containing protein [Tepidibacillus sp. HK-1]GBF10114.1 hypothetical protein HK1_00126 [Tepidibacillus sp. HK-1]
MIRCEEAKEWIQLQLDHELDESNQVLLQENLTSCSACRDYHEKMNQLHLQLSQMPKPTLHGSLVDQLFQADTNQVQIPVFKNKSRWFKGSLKKPLIGVLAASILIGLWFPVSGLFVSNQSSSSDKGQIAVFDAPINQNVGQTTFVQSNVKESKSEQEGNLGKGLNKEPNNKETSNKPTDEYQKKKMIDQENNRSVALKDPIQEEQPQRDRSLTKDPSESPKEDDAFTADENGMLISITGTEIPPFPYQIKEEDRQLVIYDQNHIEIYRTHQWEEGFSVHWIVENENLINYQLFDQQGQLIAKYQINIIEKKEEKIDQKEETVKKIEETIE